MTTKAVCESCRSHPVEVVVDSDDPNQPYRVCIECARRLDTLSLRPLEWFNLASVHGPCKVLLHDDFYSDDGVAEQPQEEVQEPEKFPAPTLKDVCDDLERLLDYAMTRYILDGDTVEALSRYDKLAVLAPLRRRVEAVENLDIEACAYEICENLLGPAAQEWIRTRWARVRPDSFLSLAAATAACLPFEEGFGHVTRMLDDETSRTQLQEDRWRGSLLGFALAPFHSRKTLDWMEAHPTLMTHENWGQVAALSHFSWPRAAEWLDQGRPLSHIALFAIQFCYRYNPVQLREYRPVFEELATVEAMLHRLDSYYEADHVPRVRILVGSIREKMMGDMA